MSAPAEASLIHCLPPRFAISGRLGEGAKGAVYEAYDRDTDQRVALKTLHKATPEAIRQFKQEFRALADVTHENLVLMHGLFCTGELWFFTMELVQGAPLMPSSDLSVSPLDEALLWPCMLQLARGVEALHAAGRLHRDLKPANILLETGGRIVVVDFGLASDVPAPGLGAWGHRPLGTPAFLAPELVRGASSSPASDWYSFGCVLYQALTGLLPFEGPSASLFARKLSLAPKAPSNLNGQAPLELCELCLELLDRDPSRRPAGPEVVERLGGKRPPLPGACSVRPGQTQLVGREMQLAAAVQWLGVSRAGPRVVLVSGASGIGKTRFAQALVDECAAWQPWVLVSRCHQQESMPFNAWDGLIDSLVDQLAKQQSLMGSIALDPALLRLFPALDSEQRREHGETETPSRRDKGEAVELRLEGGRALRQFFASLCEGRALLLFIDDLQWADEDSVRLLRELLLDVEAPPLKLIGTVREEERISSSFGSWAYQAQGLGPGCHQLTLGPLLQGDALRLLAQCFDLTGDIAARIAAEAGGSPFLLTELARSARHLPNPSRRGLDVSALVEARLEEFSPSAQRLFELVSLFAQPLPLEVALGACSAEGASRQELIRLRAGGLIRLRGPASSTQVEVYHHRLAEVGRARVSSRARQAHFLALAQAFRAQNGVNPENLAICLREAGRTEEAASFAIQAGRAARRALAFDHAVHWYQSALDLARHPPATQRLLLEALADSAFAAGRGKLAGEAYEKASLLAEPAQRIDLMRRAAQAFLASGHQDRGDAMLHRVLHSVGVPVVRSPAATMLRYVIERTRLRRRRLRWQAQATTAKERQQLLALDVAAASAMPHDPIAGWTYAMMQLRRALAGNDARLLLRALAHEITLAATEVVSRPEWNRQLEVLAREVATRVDEPEALAWYHVAIGMRTFMQGDWHEATTKFEQAERELKTQCRAVHWELAFVRRLWAASVQLAGDMGSVERSVRDWLRDAERREDRVGIVFHLLALGFALIARDALHQVPGVLTRLRGFTDKPADAAVCLHWVEAFWLGYTDGSVQEFAACYAQLKGLYRTMQRRVPLFRVWNRAYEIRMLTALISKTLGPARRGWIARLERLGPALKRENWDHASAFALQAEGTLALVAGQVKRADDCFERSAELFERHGGRLYAAANHYWAAVMGADQGRLARASQAIEALHVAHLGRMVQAHAPGIAELLKQAGGAAALKGAAL